MLDVFVSEAAGVKKLLASDREGRVVIWDLATRKVVASKETDLGNVRGLFYLPRGDRFVVVCESGAVMVFSEAFDQLDYFHVGSRVTYSKMMEPNTLSVATEQKELQRINLTTQSVVGKIKIDSKDDIRCFDISADGKYAVVVSDEIQFWKLADQSLEANLCPVLPVRCMCMTGDFISFFMSQDTHIEKWVIDWRIVHEGKKYYPPLSQYVSHDTGLEKSEVSAPKNDYKGTVETVKEEDEEDEE